MKELQEKLTLIEETSKYSDDEKVEILHNFLRKVKREGTDVEKVLGDFVYSLALCDVSGDETVDEVYNKYIQDLRNEENLGSILRGLVEYEIIDDAFIDDFKAYIGESLNEDIGEEEKAEGEDGRISKKMLDDMNLDVDAIEQEIKETQPTVDELPTQEDGLPTQEDVDNGMYTIISQELRDTLQDVENLKSIITTLKSMDGSKEEVIANLESIIDDRTIHIGMLQTMLNAFDNDTQELIDQGKLTLEEPSEEEVETHIDERD